MSKPNLKLNPYYIDVLLSRDFEYFLKKNIESHDYSKENLKILYDSYHKHISKFRKEIKNNKKQFLLYNYGLIIKMFDDGFLPSHFNIDGWSTRFDILDFKEYGWNWAIFDTWQKYESRKKRYQLTWNFIIKIGAILGILLSMLKLWNVLV